MTCTCITLRGVSTSVLQESQGLTTNTFVMLLLAMISLHMLNFRLMVTMVAEFCSLVILIHNPLLGEIMISSTRTTRVNYTSIPQYVMIHFYMQRFNFIDFMVIEVCFFKKKKKKMLKTWQKSKKHFLGYYTHFTSQHNQFLYTGYFSHLLHLDTIKSEINFKLKVKMNNIFIYGFQWG